MYNYNCPDCNDVKLQTDKNSRKINEVIDQVNALIQVNNGTVDLIEEKANKVVEEIAEIKVNEALGDLSAEITAIKNYYSTDKIDNNTTTRMIAHRGFSSKAPENSIPAIIEASKNGYWGSEFDIIETIDGHFILMHDDTVDRTTNGVGYAKEKTLMEIKMLTIDSGANINSYPNLRVPTLDEAIQCCRAYNLVPIIEIKWLYDYNNFINKINQLKIQDEAIFISFSKSVTEYLRMFYPSARIQQLYDENTFNINEVQYLKEKNFGLDCNYNSVTTDLIAVCLDNDIDVNCWTVNNQDTANYLISNNVGYITTDMCVNENSFEYKIANKNNSNINYIPYGDIIFSGRSGDPNATFNNMWNNPNPKRAVSLDKIYIPSDVDNITISKDDNVKVTLNFYNNENKLITDIGWLNNGYVEIPYGAVFCTPYWSKVDDTDFSDLDVELIRQTSINFNRKCYNFEIKEVLNRQSYGEGSKYNSQFEVISLHRVVNKNKLYIPSGVNEITLSLPANIKCSVMPFTKNHIRLSDLGWVETSNTKVALPEDTSYILLYWAKINGTEFTIDETYSCKETKILY